MMLDVYSAEQLCASVRASLLTYRTRPYGENAFEDAVHRKRGRSLITPILKKKLIKQKSSQLDGKTMLIALHKLKKSQKKKKFTA